MNDSRAIAVFVVVIVLLLWVVTLRMRQAEECVERGGTPIYAAGHFYKCVEKK